MHCLSVASIPTYFLNFKFFNHSSLFNLLVAHIGTVGLLLIGPALFYTQGVFV